MQIFSEESIRFKNKCKIHPHMELTTICRSPFCGYYRQLCNLCLLTQQQHKNKFHLPFDMATSYAESKLKEIEKSILILKRQKQQKSKTNPITLPYEVKQKLFHIRQIINQKISLFERSLEEMYEKEVNMKLESLSQTLRKSSDFLKKELNQFEKNHQFPMELEKYFINFEFWQHERKYYKSYMQEILEKQVKKFKQGFDDDNIMKLIVSFEINLKSIFSQIKQNQKKQIIQRPHLFLEEKNQLKKYEISQRLNNQQYIKPEFLGRPYPKENYKWMGKPQSIYYPDFDCFYIFGEGKTPSNAILKYEDGNLNGNKKLAFIGQMFSKRAYFSTCLINGEIFIVGGYNQKEGCMAKCQKMVVNPKMKIYLVSSLQQRSACHTVCNYKNKYILKFGGTSVKMNEKETYYDGRQIRQLYPQIYEVQKEQWRIIRYNMHNMTHRLQFGLQPLIMIPPDCDQNKIIIFGNKYLEKIGYKNVNSRESRKKKFEIKYTFSRNDVEMKIVEGYYETNKRYFIFPETLYLIEKKNKFKAIASAIDKNTTENSLHLIEFKYQN